LKSIEKQQNISIQHALSPQGEFKIGNHYLDGVDHTNKTIYEFYGCYWHGNCNHCIDANGWFNNQKTMVKLNYAKEMTNRREHYIKKQLPQYKLLTIQECEFEKQYTDSGSDFNEMLKEVEDEIATTFIQPRCFYFGGEKIQL